MSQCVCDWDERDKKFTEIEAVVRRQIKVSDLELCI
jgi:protein O-GlcNAc transferase